MTKKHLQFCIYYMQVGDPQVAYKMTYPRAAVKSLAASVSRLMARPDVAEWVNGTEERVHNRMMRKFHNEHYDQFKDQLLSINEKRTVLTKIIKDETKRVRYIKGKYGPQKVEEDLPVYAVLRAVDLDTRLENFYNYLTRSDTWRKAQNIYVNTPTLQQQVNILISQTNEKEENKNTEEQTFPLGRGTEGDVLASDTHEDHSQSQNMSPRNLSRPWREGERGSLASDTHEDHSQSQNMSPRNLSRPGREGERGNLAQDAPEAHSQSQNMSPLQGERGTLAQDTREAHSQSQNMSPRNLSRPGREGERGSLAQDTRESDNTSPHPGVPIAVGIGGNPRRKKTPHFLTKLNKKQSRDTGILPRLPLQLQASMGQGRPGDARFRD